ncbi:MAG: DUF5107 domain-containing protein [Acutalibacter sp.]|jgi:tetratricopeptide (TPR) repeat protein
MECVKIWEEEILLPTYPAGQPEAAPLFLENRAYQGSSGKVYPLPVTESVSDTKVDLPYRAVYLENEYLKVMVLPQLGGRIQRATDKTNGYDFVYYNHVIKPALVGLCGPWISGGIEFNWPQHHRPSTFSPVDCTLTQNSDGSATVYVGETDKMYGTKGTAAITLYPGKAYIEIKGRLYNPTSLPQTFLWWANPAVPVNDHTYSVFPPDVNAVMDHGKRAVSTFPIATGEYYKADYSAGVDISRYKNIPVPTSYMAAHSDYDFIGNYDEEKQAGLLHVADHHVSPGKKQWTWGNGDFGRSWDRNLTDEDGPYIELMTGVFTDNQPDFTWLKPQEEKTFTQYFMPYKGVGRVGNATKDAALSLEEQEGMGCCKVYVTGDWEEGELTVEREGTLLFQEKAALSPKACWEKKFPLQGPLEGCRATLRAGGRELVSLTVQTPELRPIPEPADPLPHPEKLSTTEELYLAATHLEQYRHATRDPEPYYLEGLKRDPTDIRLNNGYGLLLYRRGRAAESLPYFEAAIQKQTWKNPNPYSGECWYNYGLALRAVGRDAEAFDAFYKATWSAETQSPGFYWLACLAAKKGALEEALGFVDQSLVRNWHNQKGRALKAALLRHLGRDSSALVEESLAIDPLDLGSQYEQGLLRGDLTQWKALLGQDAHNALTLSYTYREAGLWKDALDILAACPAESPLLHYVRGSLLGQLGRSQEALEAYQAGEDACSQGCFPNRLEELAILEEAIAALNQAPMAHYYLGCLLYDKKQYKAAVSHWELAVGQKPQLAMAWRNLAIAYYNKSGDGDRAADAMERAFALEPEMPRFLLELDQLSARRNVPAQKRLELLEAHGDLVAHRDDLTLRLITLLNRTGQYAKALELLMGRRFHPWEGGEGKVSAQYRRALCHLGQKALEEGQPEQAISLVERALTYPENLGEGKLPNVPDNQERYLLGQAYRRLGREDLAQEQFRLGTAGPKEPEIVRYYNDQPSDYIYYQGLCHRALGQEKEALGCFHRLQAFGERHLFDQVEVDFFAVSLPEIEMFQEDLGLRNTRYCTYLRALGALGLGHGDAASLLEQAAAIPAEQPDLDFSPVEC